MGSYKVISRITIAITHIKGHITPLISTPEPPSTTTILIAQGPNGSPKQRLAAQSAKRSDLWRYDVAAGSLREGM